MLLNIRWILRLLTFACVAAVAASELFTSMAHLQTALYAERDIATALKTYIHSEEERLHQLRRIAEDLESHSSMAQENPDFYLANPVNAFLFVKRFTIDWARNVEIILSNDTVETLKQQINYYRQDLPTYEDLQGAAAALMRLQDTYKLDTSRIAEGDLGGVRSSQLSASDCYELGKLSYNTEDFHHTILWMEEALDKLNQKSQNANNQTVMKADILDYMAFSEYKKGNIQSALALTQELLVLEPDHERAANNKKYYEKMLQDQQQTEEARGDDAPRNTQSDNVEQRLDDYKTSKEFRNYEALCRGEQIMVSSDQHKLGCRYRSNKHPLLILSPEKEEDIHLDPWIVVYHNVMSDTEIDKIKRLATPRLNRATVQNARTGELEVATYRISKSAWLKAEDDPVVARINRRIGAVTGLEMETAEELQVANYGLGGHYEPHFDFARREEKDAFKSLGTGNRIATFLVYMTDVAAGGATVFPYIGVKLFPEKGAAAFWYNLYKNGEGIYNTRHAACPVLVGTKWVSNKWIHERGQEFRRPCGLHEKE